MNKEKKKLEKLFITEDFADNNWQLSFDKPAFQGGETIIIDEETAKEILVIQNNKKLN